MECNKDEAMRAKDIAVTKYTEGNVADAKKFALKAQSLFPGLEGITQMIAALEVYISAENKIDGEIDMYGILGVNPLADDETIKKQYRKLLLQLHPDKNKFIGADGAFQRVTEAFNLLSDKAKRAAYNSRHNIRTAQPKVPSQSSSPTWPKGSAQFQPKFPKHFGVSVSPFGAGRTADQKIPIHKGTFGAGSSSHHKVPTPSGSSPVSSGANGFHKTSSSTSSRGIPMKSNKSKKTSSPIQLFPKKEDTFWTKCNRCMMQYEYLRVYFNQILKCPNCQEPFAAVEVPPPSSLPPFRPQQYQKPPSSSGPQTSGHNNLFTARWSPLCGTTTHNSMGHNDSVAAKTSNGQCWDREKAKKEYEAALAAGKRVKNDDPGFGLSGEGPTKKTREMDDRVKNYSGGILSPSGIGNWRANKGIPAGESKENSGGRVNYFPDVSSKVHDSNRELSTVELKKMLSEKALVEIRQKLEEWKLAKDAKTAAKGEEKAKQKERQISKVGNDVVMSPVVDVREEAASEIMTMSVPDPDFHVFDLDRSETCFGKNQVWAGYDNDDGMPRFYAVIHEVVSTAPFKVKLSWLDSKNNSEFGPLDWEDLGLIKSCGNFYVGKCETNESLNAFSHKVRWIKGQRGGIQLYPGKGEIWAMYRNWSPDWNKDTPEDRHAYDVVEVLDNYDEERGVCVAHLVKAEGFLSVFCKQRDPIQVKRFPKEEMFRFSHQIPSHVLTGEEGLNAVKGYIELDPAATPPEFLHKVTSPGLNVGTEANAE